MGSFSLSGDEQALRVATKVMDTKRIATIALLAAVQGLLLCLAITIGLARPVLGLVYGLLSIAP